ncbi:hypothetical protein [Mycobacterium sp.]|uniref:hypothetical protein n=1 Tax=Mycobacterium sp. TaxID=1785 RepID=UPI002D2B9E87|nr:hypothetical protein [Mycobacterium sp.]HZA11123.1 hypothetical protein [Mycobacterium sp.]
MNGLYALKPWYTRRFTALANFAVAHGISPDVFAVSGVVAVVFAVALTSLLIAWS